MNRAWGCGEACGGGSLLPQLHSSDPGAKVTYFLWLTKRLWASFVRASEQSFVTSSGVSDWSGLENTLQGFFMARLV